MKALTSILLAVVFALGATLHSAAHNVSGRVTCDGKGVAGVAVSDGFEVVLTDADGRYALTSEKKNGYVFYTLPGGYEPLLQDGFMPQFWAKLDSPEADVAEVHDFVLRRVDNDRHIMIFGADTHLARRNSDRALFKNGLLARLKNEAEQAGNVPVYSMILGDLTWDVFWTQNDYDLDNFVADMKSWNYPVPLWPVIGNHDHDPSVPASANTDFEAAAAWRDIVCPNYYSFNLGKIHYVVLDDIKYLNEAEPGENYPDGVVGSRNYRGVVSNEQISWLRKDLALVDNNTPIVLCLHIPAWGMSNNFGYYARLDNTQTLCSILNNYSTVHIVSGHTHANYSARPYSYPNIVEHNLAAASGTLWQSASLSGHNVCHDGSPAGYSRWDADGKKLKWSFNTADKGTEQMRIYDMNTVRSFYRNSNAMHAIINADPSRVDYSDIDENTVLVNVFAYDTDWRVSICEGDSVLECHRVCTEDPFHTITCDVPRWNATGYYSSTYASSRSTHLFQAAATTSTLPITARAIDGFGEIHLMRIERPLTFSASLEIYETALAIGDVNADSEVNIADVNALITIVLTGHSHGCPPILADYNADGEVNIADINRIIETILNS